MGARSFFLKIAKGKKVLDLCDSLAVLKYYGIPVAKSVFVKRIEQLGKIRYPAVLKLVSPDIIHKSDFGCVIVGINSEKELQASYKKILSKARKAKARVKGFLVQEMVEGMEIIVGGKKDEQFGQTILFGLGGIFTEIYQDVSIRVVPITRKDAQQMIREIEGYKILSGYRGQKYKLNTVVNILLRVSKMLQNNPEIQQLDINPIILSAKGAKAVDARIVLS